MTPEERSQLHATPEWRSAEALAVQRNREYTMTKAGGNPMNYISIIDSATTESAEIETELSFDDVIDAIRKADMLLNVRYNPPLPRTTSNAD